MVNEGLSPPPGGMSASRSPVSGEREQLVSKVSEGLPGMVNGRKTKQHGSGKGIIRNDVAYLLGIDH
jgi:hypothetical protein